MIHTPVLLDEVLHYLNPQPGKNYIDATADGGGHAIAILKAIQPDGKILALEWDEELFDILGQKLLCDYPAFSKNCILQRASFIRLGEVVRKLKFRPVSGVLFDLGLSSYHIEQSRRGFSFQKPEEVLDMRFSQDLELTAADLIRQKSEPELEKIFKDFGQERFSRKIAGHIAQARKHKHIKTVGELVRVIRQATPSWYHRRGRHFAAKIFQALRIAVNNELENIESGLNQAFEALEPAGKIITIAFHSLEDRIIKDFSRNRLKAGHLKLITKKPIQPGFKELDRNPRARSAKMRVFAKV